MATRRTYRRSKHTSERKRIMGRFRSMSEKRVSSILRLRGIPYKYERTKIEYLLASSSKIICSACGNVGGYVKRHYIPDFELSNGVYIEVKGRLTAADRRKLSTVHKQHPDVQVCILFDADRLLDGSNRRNLRYGEWATKVGIPWAVKDIPESWLKHAEKPFSKPMTEVTEIKYNG